MRILIREILDKEGQEVELMGWVAVRRDHGKLIFIDLRDRSGIVQLVFLPQIIEKFGADSLRSEWVVKVGGTVKKRPEAMKNPEIETGDYEIEVSSLKILNESKTPPFDVLSDGREVGEEIRMKYRYLDLRRVRLQKNLKSRAGIIKFIRDFLTEKDFVEIETPILSKSTPEGARDYLVPARLHPGKFYALPQSPQQYKQLLMVAGLERYFQIARCFRDEDTRGDRQPEFTQLDLEMSFVEREDVMAINEELLIALVKECAPNKKIQEIPFPKLSYKEAMEKYGTDRPDLRKDKNDPNLFAFCWIIDFPFFKKTDSSTGSGQASGWTFTHNPFSAPKPEYMKDLMNRENIENILTSQYDVVLNGSEIGGGSIRNHKGEALKKVFEIMGFAESRINDNFGHIIEALDFGAPPHGGIAWGLDRLITIINNEPNIREVITFPKTGDGRDLMMDAPNEVDEKQIKELNLKIIK